MSTEGSMAPKKPTRHHETLWTRLEQRRKELGLSMTEVSVAAGLIPSAVSEIKSHEPAYSRVAAIAPALKTTPTWLYDGPPPWKTLPLNEDSLLRLENLIDETQRALAIFPETMRKAAVAAALHGIGTEIKKLSAEIGNN
jgi:transcriptional regulator with XRE-family HTH domain